MLRSYRGYLASHCTATGHGCSSLYHCVDLLLPTLPLTHTHTLVLVSVQETPSSNVLDIFRHTFRIEQKGCPTQLVKYSRPSKTSNYLLGRTLLAPTMSYYPISNYYLFFSLPGLLRRLIHPSVRHRFVMALQFQSVSTQIQP